MWCLSVYMCDNSLPNGRVASMLHMYVIDCMTGLYGHDCMIWLYDMIAWQDCMDMIVWHDCMTGLHDMIVWTWLYDMIVWHDCMTGLYGHDCIWQDCMTGLYDRIVWHTIRMTEHVWSIIVMIELCVEANILKKYIVIYKYIMKVWKIVVLT